MATSQVTVGKRPGNVIARRLDDVAALPAPGTTWEWSAVDCGQGTMQILRDSGLISRDRETGEWRTSRRLARYVGERHDVELGRSGQATLAEF